MDFIEQLKDYLEDNKQFIYLNKKNIKDVIKIGLNKATDYTALHPFSIAQHGEKVPVLTEEPNYGSFPYVLNGMCEYSACTPSGQFSDISWVLERSGCSVKFCVNDEKNLGEFANFYLSSHSQFSENHVKSLLVQYLLERLDDDRRATMFSKIWFSSPNATSTSLKTNKMYGYFVQMMALANADAKYRVQIDKNNAATYPEQLLLGATDGKDIYDALLKKYRASEWSTSQAVILSSPELYENYRDGVYEKLYNCCVPDNKYVMGEDVKENMNIRGIRIIKVDSFKHFVNSKSIFPNLTGDDKRDMPHKAIIVPLTHLPIGAPNRNVVYETIIKVTDDNMIKIGAGMKWGLADRILGNRFFVAY
jgi:hypothetical protein